MSYYCCGNDDCTCDIWGEIYNIQKRIDKLENFIFVESKDCLNYLKEAVANHNNSPLNLSADYNEWKRST